jgi:hypothetical protein
MADAPNFTPIAPDPYTYTGANGEITSGLNSSVPKPLPGGQDPYSYTGSNGEITSSLNASATVDPAKAAADRLQNEADVAAKFAADGLKSPATQRATNANPNDWRVRISLAETADYLYMHSENAGILEPLVKTDGVLFPYTPKIDQTYEANYETADLVHSNYKGYFYKNSAPQQITVSGTFTANSTEEANYLLAVIHFFKSATKMFYGQDANRGVPPPVCFLSGFGTYQFNRHPVLIQQFQYSMPDDVDYIKAGTVQTGLPTTVQPKQKQTAFNTSSLSRLLSSGLFKGATKPGKPAGLQVTNYGIDDPTYVPTKINITIQLLPLQSREQMSTEFSLEKFANGELTKRGFY